MATTINDFLSNGQVYGVKFEPVASHPLTDDEKKMYSTLRIQEGTYGLQACFLIAGKGEGRTAYLTLDRKSNLTTPGDYPMESVDVSLNEYAQMDKHTVCVEASKK